MVCLKSLQSLLLYIGRSIQLYCCYKKAQAGDKSPACIFVHNSIKHLRMDMASLLRPYTCITGHFSNCSMQTMTFAFVIGL